MLMNHSVVYKDTRCADLVGESPGPLHLTLVRQLLLVCLVTVKCAVAAYVRVLSRCGSALHVSWGAGIPAVPQFSWPHGQHWVPFLLWPAAHNIVYSFLCAGVQALPWHNMCASQPLCPSSTLCLAADTCVSCSGACGTDLPDHSFSFRVATVLIATPWPTSSGHLAHVRDITGATAAIFFRCLQGPATWCPPARHGSEDCFGHGEGSSFLAFQEDCSF